MDKMREEFEAWIIREKGSIFLNKTDSPALWRGSKEDISAWEGRPYEHPWTAGAWEGWRASRAAVVVELPEGYVVQNGDFSSDDLVVERCDVVAAIEAAGIKVVSK